MPFEPETLDLKNLLQRLVDEQSVFASEKDIAVELNISKQTKIFADKNMIHSALANVLVNAIKYSPKGETITITLSEKLDRAIIEVKDNGVGMSESQLEDIFHLEKAMSTVDTEGKKGTGLGLLLCKEFIDRNNGEIKVESEKDVGSKFTIVLPLM